MKPDQIGDEPGLLRHRIRELREAIKYLEELRGPVQQVAMRLREMGPIPVVDLGDEALIAIRMWVQIDKIRRVVADLEEEHPA